jgi:hypothetical protein
MSVRLYVQGETDVATAKVVGRMSDRVVKDGTVVMSGSHWDADVAVRDDRILGVGSPGFHGTRTDRCPWPASCCPV